VRIASPTPEREGRTFHPGGNDRERARQVLDPVAAAAPATTAPTLEPAVERHALRRGGGPAGDMGHVWSNV
jgi:hypothetical protein